jgi:aerobic-type carbon monoxide dehydrogenase small subunit (CoxS/CutS family)
VDAKMKAMVVSGGSDILRDEGISQGTLSLNLEEAFDLIERAGCAVHSLRFSTVLMDGKPLHSALILIKETADEKH